MDGTYHIFSDFPVSRPIWIEAIQGLKTLKGALSIYSKRAPVIISFTTQLLAES
jgi:hypothetical protein